MSNIGKQLFGICELAPTPDDPVPALRDLARVLATYFQGAAERDADVIARDYILIACLVAGSQHLTPHVSAGEMEQIQGIARRLGEVIASRPPPLGKVMYLAKRSGKL